MRATTKARVLFHVLTIHRSMRQAEYNIQQMKIHLVKTRLVNSYVVEYETQLLIVDVAIRCERYVLGYVEQELKRNIADISLVTCTHDDPDHMGGVFELAQLCDADVALPFAAGSHLHKLKNNVFGMFTRFTTGVREAFRPRAWKMYMSKERNIEARQHARYDGGSLVPHKPLKTLEDHRLQANDVIPLYTDWRVIHTPGHSWDSVCFYHADSQSLLSGDTLLGSGSLGRLVTPAIYSNASQTEQTLDTLEQLPLKVVYPGHGSIMRGAQLIEDTRA